MSEFKLDDWLKNLGQSQDTLISRGMISNEPLIELYPGTDTLHLEPEVGIDFGFWAETKILEVICITLHKITPSEVVFTGRLPAPYESLKSQELVREYFGQPSETKGPMRLPLPLGEVGGWDLYKLESKGYSNVRVVFKYTVELKVKGLAFALIDTGRE